MDITVVGWYGTETLGDRAILAGIISKLSSEYGDFNLRLGSLYPFFSQRTLYEDIDFYKKYLNYSGKVTVFNSRNVFQLRKNIKSSDLLIMGGGPLMHIKAMYMVLYAFKYAKKAGIRRLIYGCGVGPIFDDRYVSVLDELFDAADGILLRDQRSWETARLLVGGRWDDKISVSLDPAVETCIRFLSKGHVPTKDQEYIAVSLRAFPRDYAKDFTTAKRAENRLSEFLHKIVVLEKHIKLIPMHYFHIGNDDRVFLNEQLFRIDSTAREMFSIQNKPLTLEETLSVFNKADLTFGMRFHSVVLQTLVNGKNYILDYTDEVTGKIGGFVEEMSFPKERYLNLQAEEFNLEVLFKPIDTRFNLDVDLLKKKLEPYSIILK